MQGLEDFPIDLLADILTPTASCYAVLMLLLETRFSKPILKNMLVAPCFHQSEDRVWFVQFGAFCELSPLQKCSEMCPRASIHIFSKHAVVLKEMPTSLMYQTFSLGGTSPWYNGSQWPAKLANGVNHCLCKPVVVLCKHDDFCSSQLKWSPDYRSTLMAFPIPHYRASPCKASIHGNANVNLWLVTKQNMKSGKVQSRTSGSKTKP